MRIGFDGRALGSPAGGMRRYTRELFGAMRRVAPEIEVLALGAPAEGGAPPDGVRAVPLRGTLPTNLGWTAVTLARAARRARLDLFHAPSYTAPPWGVHPLVLTIHDVSYERHPEWYPYRRDPLRRWFYRRSALAADRIVTDSQFSRAEIAAAYGIDPGRIRVVPLGVGPEFSPGDSVATPAPRVRRPYLLHVGDLHPRRNLPMVVRAFAAARAAGPFGDLGLVLAGTDRGHATEVTREAQRAGVADAVLLTGPIDAPTLLRLYRSAALFVYPSRYEGFGLPVLEAMATGLPVIAARASSIPEVAGDAGMLVDAGDEHGFATAIRHLLEDPTTAAHYRSAGLARSASFTWERAAAATLEVYRELLGEPPIARGGA